MKVKMDKTISSHSLLEPFAWIPPPPGTFLYQKREAMLFGMGLRVGRRQNASLKSSFLHLSKRHFLSCSAPGTQAYQGDKQCNAVTQEAMFITVY